MILIISNESDLSTCDVIEWLRYFNIEYFRINDTDRYFLSKYEFDSNNCNIELIINNEKKQFNYLKAIWYRRGYLNNLLFNSNIENVLQTSKLLNDHFINLFEKSAENVLGAYKEVEISKLDMLFNAKKVGFNVPETILTSSKHELQLFLKTHKEIVTKSIQNSYRYSKEGINYASFTTLITNELFNTIPDVFSPALFQKKIDKIYEVRIFYLDGEIFSSAVFQKNNNSDYRTDELENLRIFPIKLPNNIISKVLNFFTLLSTNTGSIDLIYNGIDYVFLELNPVGQFNFVSTKCNYKLEKKIAEWLKK